MTAVNLETLLTVLEEMEARGGVRLEVDALPFEIRVDMIPGPHEEPAVTLENLRLLLKTDGMVESDVDPNPDFMRELTSLLNRFSAESESDTPDFILARYIRRVLGAFDWAVNARRDWHGTTENTRNWWHPAPSPAPELDDHGQIADSNEVPIRGSLGPRPPHVVAVSIRPTTGGRYSLAMLNSSGATIVSGSYRLQRRAIRAARRLIDSALAWQPEPIVLERWERDPEHSWVMHGETIGHDE